jgi:hypothetical protein
MHVFGALLLIVSAGLAIMTPWFAQRDLTTKVPGRDYLVVSREKVLVLYASEVQTILSADSYREVMQRGRGMFLVSSDGIEALAIRPTPKAFSLGNSSVTGIDMSPQYGYTAILIILDDCTRQRLHALAEILHEEHLARTAHRRPDSSSACRWHIITPF